MLRPLDPGSLARARRSPVDPAAFAVASEIVSHVRERGEAALRAHAERFDGLDPGAPLIIERPELEAALRSLDPADRASLERAAQRIRAFAEIQRSSVRDVETAAHGATMGQTVIPMERAGCYAPGGRYPLPSSVLMTAIPARIAGVQSVVVASPGPAQITLAAAAVAGADALLPVGGAQAIAALAFGAGEKLPIIEGGVDIVVGPGNAYVTAAKQIVSGTVAIDMLAGPSELVVIADRHADARTVAADLLAQAEHDPQAGVTLITTSARLIDAVNKQLAAQLETLPTAKTARASIDANGASVLVASLDEAAAASDRLAPEHLELAIADANEAARIEALIRHAGAIFVGDGAAEVFGDYGLGPNHTLPTGGTARSFAGLSVHNFLRVRTHIRAAGGLDESVIEDTARLARLEGLEAHARAAECRLSGGNGR
jgi:phosphoribosyl-ATP pyrophosphohydrolase/phosphoribosyl-AMP cyclohydrolase/histidinol dehydrogenase